MIQEQLQLTVYQEQSLLGQVVTVSGAGSTPAASITATSRNPNVTSGISTNNEH